MTTPAATGAIEPVNAIYNRDVFSRAVMRQRLPKDVFKKLTRTIDLGEKVGPMCIRTPICYFEPPSRWCPYVCDRTHGAPGLLPLSEASGGQQRCPRDHAARHSPLR